MMSYFTLKLERPGQDDPFFVTDFALDSFAYPIRMLALTLTQRGMFFSGERFDARLLPRTDDQPSFDKPSILQGQAAEETAPDHPFLDVMFENDQSDVEDIRYLTLHLRSIDRGFAYSFDMRLDDRMMGIVLTQAVQALMDSDQIKPGEPFTFKVEAHTGDAMQINPLLKRAQVTTSLDVPSTMQQSLSPQPDGTDQTPPVEQRGTPEQPIEVTVSDTDRAADSDSEINLSNDLDIVIESVEELIKPEEKRMASYSNAEERGKVAAADLPIFIRRSAMAVAARSARLSREENIEVGGFLVGNVFKDPDNGRMFIEIAEAVATDKAEGTFVQLDFNYDAWRQVIDRIDSDFPDKFPVGWYHTHLISQAVVVPVPDQERLYRAMYITFFSHLDVSLHRSFFPDNWHVALVMDVKLDQEVFFIWREGMIVRAQGFYLYGD